MILKVGMILHDPMHPWQSMRVIEIFQYTVALKQASKYAKDNPLMLFEIADIEHIIEENELEIQEP